RVHPNQSQHGQPAGVQLAADSRPFAADRVSRQQIVARRHPAIVTERSERQAKAVEQATNDVAEQGGAPIGRVAIRRWRTTALEEVANSKDHAAAEAARGVADAEMAQSGQGNAEQRLRDKEVGKLKPAATRQKAGNTRRCHRSSSLCAPSLYSNF